MKSHEHRPNGGWRKFVSKVCALLMFAATQPALADVTFNWIPISGSSTMDAPLAGKIVISDAAYQAGSFSVNWYVGIGCPTFNGCATGPNSPTKEFYFWYFDKRTTIDFFPASSGPAPNFVILDMVMTVQQGRLLGTIVANNAISDVAMASGKDGTWTISHFASDMTGSGCGFQKICEGATGYWMDASVPAPATLALVAAGGLLALRRKRQA